MLNLISKIPYFQILYLIKEIYFIFIKIYDIIYIENKKRRNIDMHFTYILDFGDIICIIFGGLLGLTFLIYFIGYFFISIGKKIKEKFKRHK